MMLIKEATEIIADEYARLRLACFSGGPPPALLKFVYVPIDGADTTKHAPSDWGYDYMTTVLQCLIYEADLQDEGLAIGGMIDFNASMGETNEGMYSDEKLVDWADWRWNLVHELCHEYEHLVLRGIANDDGWQLFHTKCVALNQPPRFIPAHKHPVAFYSAIVDFANCFGLTPERLHDTI